MFGVALTILAVSHLGIMSPGPDSFLVIRNSVRYPLREALATSLGIATGVLFHLSLCTLGIATLLITFPLALTVLTYVGAAYLFYIGVNAVRSAGDAVSPEITDGQKIAVPWRQAFREGLVCNLLNPKVSLFFLGLFSQLVPKESTIFERAFYASLIAVHALIYWTLLATLIQKLRLDKVILRWGVGFDRVFGLVLIAISLRLVFSVAH